MSSVPFSIIDVFSGTPYKGNPLAIVDSTEHDLSTTQQQLLTRQFNLSETTFFFPPTQPQATYRLRSFLPDGKEVFGAGHNILGVWWHLAQAGRLQFNETTLQQDIGDGSQEFLFHQELGGEVIPVKILRKKTPNSKDSLEVVLRQSPPQVHGIHPDIPGLAKSIGLEASDIGFQAKHGDALLPPQVTSTSTTHHLLVPLASTAALNKAVVQRDTLLQQLAAVDKRAYGLFLFARTGTNQYEARFFSPGMSGEDPATGSAAGPLSAYLHEHKELVSANGALQIEVRQGLRVGRDCLIKVALSIDSAGTRQVDLIGGGVDVAEGRIRIPGRDVDFN